MRFQIIWIGIVMLFVVSCNKENPIGFAVVDKRPFLGDGKWISQSDSLNGIAVIENKLAIFNDMKFSSADICKHQIIDSVFQVEGHKKVIPYVQVICDSDTVYYKLLERNDFSFRLQLDKTRQEKYVLRK